jgi:hypothetical protein
MEALADLQSRVNEDPFVAASIVTAEIIEISVSKTVDQLDFLLECS